MGIYEQLGLDSDVDRNSFTNEQAAKVFEKAAADIRSGKAVDAVLETLKDGAFELLPVIISLV